MHNTLALRGAQNRQNRRSRRRVGLVASIATAALALTGVGAWTLGTAAPAAAQDNLSGNITTENQLSWSIDVTHPGSVLSGDSIEWRFGLQCSDSTGHCQSATVRISAPAGASGPGVFQGSAPADLTISNDGHDLVVHYDGSLALGAGTARYFTVVWPTANGSTAPGRQTAVLSVTTDGGITWPTQPSASVDLLADSVIGISKRGQTPGGQWGEWTHDAYYNSEFTYLINVGAKGLDPNNTGHGFLNLKGDIVDKIPDGAEFVRCGNVSGGQCQYDSLTRTLTVKDVNLGGSTVGVSFSFYVVIRFPNPATAASGNVVAPADTDIPNTATYTATQFATGKTLDVSDTWDVRLSTTDPDPSISTGKTGEYNGLAWTGQSWAWRLAATNKTAVPATVTFSDMQIDPDWFDLVSVDWADLTTSPSEGWMQFTYESGATSSKIDFTAGTASVPVPNHSDTNRVTGILVFVASLPGGARTEMKLMTTVSPRSATGDGPWTVENCMVVTAENASEASVDDTACGRAAIAATPPPGLKITKLSQTKGWFPGDTFTWTFGIANNVNNGSTLTPTIWDVIPRDLTYIPGSLTLVRAKDDASCPTADQFTESIDSAWYSSTAPNGPSFTRVEWKADSDVAIPYASTFGTTGGSCEYSYQTQVRPGTPVGTYTGPDASNVATFQGNRIFLKDQLIDGPVVNWTQQDYFDIDGDGRTATESMGHSEATFQVASKAQYENTKQVSGNLDTDASGQPVWFDSAEITGQSDQVGTSTPGGSVSYRLTLGNYGNEPLTDIVAYDLLPYPDNPGVTAVRYAQQPRGDGNEWIPTMTGPLDLSALPQAVRDGVRVTYSDKTDPCRPEMQNSDTIVPAIYCDGQQDTSWMSAPQVAASSGGWGAVRSIRIDFGDHVFAGGEMYTLTYTMAAPMTLAGGAAITGGERTWNKLAIQGAQVDGQGNRNALMAAEYPWVVDQLFVTPQPEIVIRKWSTLDGPDAGDFDSAPGKTLEPGVAEQLSFTITNSGGEDLKDIVVTDTTTAGGVAVQDLSCDFSPLGGPTAGTTWTGPFAVGDSFTCTATLPGLPAGVQHTDVATVRGTGVVSNAPVDSTNPWNGRTPPTLPDTDTGTKPAIDIEKWSSVDGPIVGDHDTAPGKTLTPNTAEAITFTVTNRGDEPLVDVVVSDVLLSGSGTLTGLSCDFSALGGPATGTTWAGPLPVGASFSCAGQVPGIGAGQSHADRATVTAKGAQSGTAVSDSDDWNGTVPLVRLPITGAWTGAMAASAAVVLAAGLAIVLLVNRRRLA